MLVSSLILCGAMPAYAHETISDNSIAATLHIDPADSPGAHEQSYLQLTFTNKDNKLDLRQCNCIVSIASGSTTIFSEKTDSPDFSTSRTILGLPFEFPAKGIYMLTITGQPLSDLSFQAFSITYTIRVDRDSGKSISLYQRIIGSHWFHHLDHIIIFGGGFIVGLVFIAKDRKKKKRYTGNKSIDQ